jgi:hypothetical protein
MRAWVRPRAGHQSRWHAVGDTEAWRALCGALIDGSRGSAEWEDVPRDRRCNACKKRVRACEKERS